MEKLSYEYKKINLNKKFNKISDYWSPKVIAEMNDYQFKLAKVKDEFIWNKHDNTDETFIVINGTLTIEFKTETVMLGPGEMIVVPKGVEHKPRADQECNIMLIEPRGVTNTGDSESEMTAENDVWV